jgi:hypothetical protein
MMYVLFADDASDPGVCTLFRKGFTLVPIKAELDIGESDAWLSAIADGGAPKIEVGTGGWPGVEGWAISTGICLDRRCWGCLHLNA